MNNNSSILFGLFDEFLWIRCSGRGSFANSPTVKSLGDDYIASGGRLIVIDLETCSGIDSTFMGTLAGLSRRLLPIGGSVQIASPSERCLSALESLGLDALHSTPRPGLRALLRQRERQPWGLLLRELRVQRRLPVRFSARRYPRRGCRWRRH